MIGCLLLTTALFAQNPAWAKKAANAVFTLKTFDANNQLIGSSNGFFVNNNGEAVSSYLPFKGAKRAVIIDHVGNYARHGLPDEDRHWNLTSKKETKKKQEKDVPIKQCNACFRVFPPKDEKGNRYTECPFCGAPLPKSSRELEEDAAATLQRIESITLTYDSPNDCNSYQELLAYARRKGYKKGWAWYQARARGMI